MGDFGSYRGEEVRGFLASDDLTTATEVQLRPLNFDGSTYRTLVAGERLVVDTVAFGNGATASIMTLFNDWNDDGTVDAGEELISASLGVNGQFTPNIGTPIICNQVSATYGRKIKVKASAASVGSRVFFSGRIVKS